jgi:hypothetical protein
MIILLLADFICSHGVGFLQSDLASSVMLITPDKVLAGRQMIPLVIAVANKYHHHGKSEGRHESIALKDKTLVHAEEKNVKWTLTPAQKRREKLLQQLNKMGQADEKKTDEKKAQQKNKSKKKKAKKEKKEVYVIYHESTKHGQERHSAKHALNSLFQLPNLFSTILMNRIALAQLGSNIYVFGETSESCSWDLKQLLDMQTVVDQASGNWSQAVVSTALLTHKLALHELDQAAGEVESVMFEYEKYAAIMFLNEAHWTVMRKIGIFWWHFDSNSSSPRVIPHVGLGIQQILADLPTASCFTVLGELPLVQNKKDAALKQGAEMLALSGVQFPDLTQWLVVKEVLTQEQWKAWIAMVKANSPQNQKVKAIARQMVQVAMKTLLWKGMNQWCTVVLRERQQDQMKRLMGVSVHRTLKHLLFKGWNQWRQVVRSGSMDPMTDPRTYENWETVVMPSCYTFCDPTGTFPEEVILVLRPVMLHVCAVAEEGYGECKGAFEWYRVEEYQNTNSGDDTTDIFQISIAASRSSKAGNATISSKAEEDEEEPSDVIASGGVWVFEHEGDDFEGAFREWTESHWAAKRKHETRIAMPSSSKVSAEQSNARSRQEEEEEKKRKKEEKEKKEKEEEEEKKEKEKEEEAKTKQVQPEAAVEAGEGEEGGQMRAGEGVAEGSLAEGGGSTNWNVATKTILTANRWLARTRKNRPEGRTEGRTEGGTEGGTEGRAEGDPVLPASANSEVNVDATPAERASPEPAITTIAKATPPDSSESDAIATENERSYKQVSDECKLAVETNLTCPCSRKCCGYSRRIPAP